MYLKLHVFANNVKLLVYCHVMMATPKGVTLWPVTKEVVNKVRTFRPQPNGAYVQHNIDPAKLEYYFITPIKNVPPCAVRHALSGNESKCNSGCILVETTPAVDLESRKLVTFAASHAFHALNLSQLKMYHKLRELPASPKRLVGEHQWAKYLMMLELPHWPEKLVDETLETWRGLQKPTKPLVEVIMFLYRLCRRRNFFIFTHVLIDI